MPAFVRRRALFQFCHHSRTRWGQFLLLLCFLRAQSNVAYSATARYSFVASRKANSLVISTCRQNACNLKACNNKISSILLLSSVSYDSSSGGGGGGDPIAEDVITKTEELSSSASSLAVNRQSENPEPPSIQSSEITKKVLNGLLLAVCFGYAAYTILNIDSGMTRGWTQSEIAMRIPLDNWLNYESSLADRPIFTKTTINVIIYLLGDWLSQTIFSKKNVLDFDAGRTLRNGFIGLCFGPLVHEYYQFSDYILPVEGGMWNRLEKIVMDQTIYLTVKCSIYIAAVGLLRGDDVESVKTNVQTKLPNIVVTAWKFWPLVHLVTYGVIPARHRILWVNCVDLVWNAILASMSQRKEIPEEEESEPLPPELFFLEEEPSDLDRSVAIDDSFHLGQPSILHQDMVHASVVLEHQESLFKNETSVNDEVVIEK
jgi:protein Mpv17